MPPRWEGTNAIRHWLAGCWGLVRVNGQQEGVKESRARDFGLSDPLRIRVEARHGVPLPRLSNSFYGFRWDTTLTGDFVILRRDEDTPPLYEGPGVQFDNDGGPVY